MGKAKYATSTQALTQAVTAMPTLTPTQAAKRAGLRLPLFFLCCFVLCALVVGAGGCAAAAHAASPHASAAPHSAAPGAVFYSGDEFNAYGEALSRILPSHAISQTSLSLFEILSRGAAVEAFDLQAISALEAGAAHYWYPQYLSTVVIAVDRSRTDAGVGGWRDLSSAGEAVGFSKAVIDCEMLIGALAYGLEGKDFTLGKAVELLAALAAKGHFVENSFEPPIVICFDHQAVEMIRRGRDIEIVVPVEGTLVYEKGVLSPTPLRFTEVAESILLSMGFRLPDGRADAGLYPDAAAYASAAQVTDAGHFASVCQDALRLLRRDVLRIHLYSSKDGRQHQLFMLIYMVFVLAWASSVMYRAMRKGVRQAVFLTAILLLGWGMVRLIKYQINAVDVADRYLWYSYYLFQLALPLVLFWFAYVIDKPDGVVPVPAWFRALVVCNALIFLLVFTNDLHFLTFTLDPGNPSWASEYGYGIGYYLSLVGSALPLFAGLALLIVRSRGNMRQKGLVFPAVFILLLAAYCYGYVNRISIARYSDMTMVIGLFTVLLYETIIRIGLIPVNTKYAVFLAHSPLGIQITDASGAVALRSAAAADYSYDEDAFAHALASSPVPVRKDEDTLLFAADITGGYVLWHEDIADVNRLHRKMEESVRSLEVANAVLMEEEEIRRAIDAENARTQLMTQLEAEITSHTIRLSTMIEQLEEVTDKPKATSRIALLLCYLKRRCNLFFQEKEAVVLPWGELMIYFDEMAEIADYAQVKVALTNRLTDGISVRRATLLYDYFYNVVYWATWSGGIKILVDLAFESGCVVLRLLPSEDARSFRMEKRLETAITAAGGSYAAKEIDDDAIGFTLSFPGGGEDHA